MGCFCDKPVAKLHHSASQMLFKMTPPQIPIQLKLAGALGIAMDPERADIRLSAIMDNIQTPRVQLGGGPMVSLAMALTTTGMTFKIDDIPALEAQMQQMATSLEKNVLPRMSFLMSIPLLPIIRLSIIARLALQIPKLNIDPMLPDEGVPPAVPSSILAMRLSPPKLVLAKIAVGLPPLFKLAEELKLPLGDPNLAQKINNRLSMLAQITPPKLVIKLPILLRLAAVLDALAVIKEAFGPDAMTPQGLNRIANMLRTYMRLSWPIPMPVLALAEQIPTLPKPDAVIAGTELLNHPAARLLTNIPPPRLQIAPFLTAMLAFKLPLTAVLGVEPMDACDVCPF